MTAKLMKIRPCYWDTFFLAVLAFFLVFYSFDFQSTDFSWMAFQERDYGRATDFIVTGKLSHLGPEISNGGFLPGPFLTLLFVLPAALVRSPQGIHYLIQLSFILSIFLTFFVLKKYVGRGVAYLSVILLALNQNFIFFSYTGWHAALIPFMNVFILWLYGLREKIRPNVFYVLFGFVMGVGMQIHFSMLSIYLVYFLGAVIFARTELKRAFLPVLVGFFLSMSYYLYCDGLNGFSNFSLILQKSDTMKNLLSTTVLDIINGYDNFVSLPFINSSYPQLTIFALFVVIFNIVKNRQRKINFILLGMVLLPVFHLRVESRFYLVAHPFYEIMMSLGVFKLMGLIPSRPFRMGLLGILVALSGWFFLPFDLKRIPEFTIYYSSYKQHKKITEVIRNDLKLTPDDYGKRFYFYPGKRSWSFDTPYPLPSVSSYTLQYAGDGRSRLGEQEGVILAEEKTTFRPARMRFENVQEENLRSFKAFWYRSEYIYHQPKPYTEYLDDENLQALDVFNVTKDSIKIKKKVRILHRGMRNLDFFYVLSLRKEGNELRGYMEIVSPFLRQSSFAEQSPFYVINPQLILTFSDGTSKKYQMMKDHFFSLEDKMARGWEEVYRAHGKLSDSLNLGSLYQEAPYGLPIIVNKKLIEIKSITFKIDGHGSFIEKQPVLSEHLTKINLP